jgi:hypothetical protein
VNQTKTKLRIKQRTQAEREIADAQAACIGALVSGGYSREHAGALANEAVRREKQMVTRPLGIEGESAIQEANQVWAALDTVEYLCLTDLPGMDGEPPDPVAVSLGLIDCDNEIQIRVAGTDDERVTNYAARMKAEDDFPPLVLFFDRDEGEEDDDWHLWLADGFHRYRALLRTMDYTARATIYAGTRRDAEEYAATCNARHGLPLSNADKRAASRRLLKLHPEWTDREIARRVGASHPTVGKVRWAMEAEAEASGKDYQMSETRVVTRGDQTYEYAPPEQDEAPDTSDCVPFWTLERGLRSYLDEHAEDVADRIAEVEEILHHRDYERVTDHLAGPRRKHDVVQALNNVLEQLCQRTGSRKTTLKPDSPPRADGSLSATDATVHPAGRVQHFEQALVSGDGHKLRRLVADHSPSVFTNALRAVFARDGCDEWRAATSCLIEAIESTRPLGLRDAEGERAWPECGERVIPVSANGKRARDICVACGTAVDIEEMAG